MAIVDATQLDGVLRSLRQSHAGASTLTEHALVGDIVILWLAAEFLRRDFLEFLLGVHRGRVRRACHCVGRLAAAGNTTERKVIRRVAPCNVALLPRNSQNFGTCTVNVDHRLRSQVADSRLEGYSAIGLDDQNPIEADRATDKTTERDADAAHLGTDPLRGARDPFAPFKLFRPPVERFLEERTRGVRPLPLHRRSEWRLALRTIDSADDYLVEPEFTPSFRDDRLHDCNALHAAWRALRTPRGRVGQNRDSTPAHGLRLVQE